VYPNVGVRYSRGRPERKLFILVPCPASSEAWYFTITTGYSLFVGVAGALAYLRQVVSEDLMAFGLLRGREGVEVVGKSTVDLSYVSF
jgi:hypothetical protein